MAWLGSGSGGRAERAKQEREGAPPLVTHKQKHPFLWKVFLVMGNGPTPALAANVGKPEKTWEMT